MATLNATLSLTSKDTTIKNKVALVFSKQISTTNPVIHSGTFSVLHSGLTEVVTTSVSATTYVYLKNLDGTNFVDLNNGAGTSYAILSAGEFCFIPIKGTKGLKLQADTATCLVEYGIFTKA
jgi:hypothetical protein